MNPRIDLRIPLTASPQGHRLQRILAEIGVVMSPWVGDEALVGWWASPAGGRVVQIAELMRNQQGLEYLYWYSSPLFSLGAVPGNDVAFIGVTAAIPAALETICYLSECPAPMGLGALMLVGGRGPVLFGSGSEYSEYPRPVARLQVGSDPHSTNFLACTSGDNVTAAYFAGARVDLGLAVDLHGSDASVTRSIHVAIASACRTAAIIEDGFANHSEGELAFGQVLLSQDSAVDGGEQRWLPTSVAGYFTDVLTLAE